MRKKSLKRGMSVLSSFIIGFTTVAGLMGSGLTVNAATSISNPRVADDGTVTWDKVTFGSYYQDMNEIVEEPIKWRILSVNEDGTDAYLLADKGLDCKPYNDVAVEIDEITGHEIYSCSWKDSTLRNWLNNEQDSNSFINKAFDTAERSAINPTKIGSVSEGETEDKIYLPDVNDLNNENYGFNSQVKKYSGNYYSPLWTAKGTDYAYINGAWRYYDENCIWWIRWSYTGTENFPLSSISYFGQLENNYDELNNPYSVRPVLHVNLNNDFISYAGTVSSDGSFNDDLGNIIPDYSTLAPVWDEDNETETWNCVYFGKYKQNATFQKKPIEWRVLSVDGDDAFLMADKALDSKPFNDENGIVKEVVNGWEDIDYSCTWENSSLRRWLNDESDSESFINNAFSPDEKMLIKTTSVVNDGKDADGHDLVDCGDDSEDKIYLLSAEEASDYDYGFDEANDYEGVSGYLYYDLSSSTTRKTQASDYAYINGFRDETDTSSYDAGCNWWLRSTSGNEYGRYTYMVKWSDNWESYVDDAGYIYIGFHGHLLYIYCVRPVLHINYKAALEQGLMKVSDEKVTAFDGTQKVVADINELISAIETPITVDFGDDEAVKDIDNRLDYIKINYNILPNSAKERVTNYDDFLAARAAYEELKNQDKEDSDNAAKVDELISAIGTPVTLDSKSKITSARTAYDALTSGAKNKVTKYADLQAAEKALAELEKKASSETTQSTETQKSTEATTENTTTEASNETVTDAQMKKTTPAVAKVETQKTKKGKASVTIKWKKVKGANGYKIYRSTKKNKGYKCVKTIKKASVKSWKDTGVKSGKKYYYKMRAYKKSGKKTIYSKYSSTKRIKVK